jgi:glycosyltransferase involved in cell wall biosynthesis/polysaccharide pyruvyl transferase WcaK-like protein/MoaA/NifB/PqqE/SkfB family radical SAM enzyme
MRLAPIGVSTYSRLDHLKQTIVALQKNTLAKASELYIFSDAPKLGDEEKVKKVRNYIHTIDGFKTVNIVERATNNRVNNGRGGLCDLLYKYGRTIFMEDDVVTAPGFLRFMNESLNYYEHQKNILAISGYNVPANFPESYKYDYYLSAYFNGWGYATWADRSFMETLEYKDAYNEVMHNDLLYEKIDKIHPKLINGLKQIQDGKLDAADYKLVFYSIKNNFYTIKPVQSFVHNIGHDGSGVHCGKSNKFEQTFPLNNKRVKFFKGVNYEFEIDQIFYQFFHPETLIENEAHLPAAHPETLNFMANDICNSRCKMCRVWKQKHEKEINPKEFATVINNPLFRNLKYVGVSGGEPTLRKDLTEIFRVIASKEGIKGTGLITNALVAEQVINQVTKCNEVCMHAHLPFNVMVSLDGIGEIHDAVRGRKGAFENALKVIRHIRDNTNIELSIGCTVIKQNIWNLDEVLEFCRREKVSGRFRIAEFINRLYNNDLKTSIRNFDDDERYQIALFFSKLELIYETSPAIKQTYRNIRQMIFEGKPRESGCPYQSEALGLDSRGNLLFCSPKSPDLGSCLENSALSICAENQSKREAIIQSCCNYCIHDYHAAPSKESLEEHAQEELLKNCMSVRQSIVNANMIPSALPEALEWSKFNKALIIGWYGTETIGDKAIIGDIIRRLKKANPQIQITIASLYPFVTKRTLQEIKGENIGIIKTYSPEYIDACKSTDAVIMGGGPLMGMEPLGFVLTAFSEARKMNIPCVVEGCGIGPLVADEHIRAVKEILRLSTQIKVRDKTSLSWVVENADRADAICTGDPAACFVEEWKKEALKDQKIHNEEYFACFLREITLEYANGESPTNFLAFRERFENELGKLIRRIWEKTGLKPLLMPMHTFAVGEDDREFARRFAKTYLPEGEYEIGNKVYSPQDILSVMSRSKFNVCMRFHSVLFAEKLDVPFVAIDYTGGGKIKGFLEDQNKFEFMFDRSEISDGNWKQKIDAILLRHNLRSMNVVHICSQDYGGAGKAAYRLHKGLQQIGVSSKMLVVNKKSGDPSVKVFPSDFSGSLQKSISVSAYESPLWPQQMLRWKEDLAKYPNRPTGLEIFTDALSDIHLDQIQDIRNADIINLHWVAGAMDYPSAPLSMRDKQIVWTLHDMNPFTGGCHYSGDCEKYKESCGACPQLGSTNEEDLSRQIWIQKNYAFQSLNLRIVTPSKWLANCVLQSQLLSLYPVKVIPNGFPLDTFKPYAKTESRKALHIPENAKVILFGADYLVNERKGFAYLLEALKRLRPNKNYPTIVLIFGNLPEGLQINTEHTICSLGLISDENKLALAYSAADVFVIPSLEDNLPNTVVEAMACGVPVVGFDIGGIPDMVEHKKTGFLVRPRDIEGLSEGIAWVISSFDNGANFSKQCREKVEKEFALEMQANAYHELYSGILQKHRAVHRNACKKAGWSNQHSENCLSDSDQPMISVITPSFNQSKFIEKTINSVLRQNYSNFEHIIIDGGSTDGTIEILKRYPHLKWISEKDSGQSEALNKGLRIAKGEIVGWINSDDWYEPGTLGMIASFFNAHPTKNVVMGNCNLVDENGIIFDKVVNQARGFEELKKYWIGRSIPTQPAVFFRRNLLDQHGYIDETLHYAMDYDLWMRFAQKNHFYHLDVTVANYRFHQAAKGGDQDWNKFVPEWKLVSERYTKLPESTIRISVIIPCYNYAKYLREAVESVIAQTFQDFEIIIINDGSTDNTKEVAESLIAKYPNYPIRLINQENSGQPAISRNRGILEANGEYILCLDADDMILPTMLEKCLNILEQDRSIAIAYTDRQDFDGVNQIVRAKNYDFSQLKYANHISYCALFRREVWDKVGGYRTNIKGCEDWDFWVAAGSRGYFGRRIPEPLFKYRRHDTGVFQEVLGNYNTKFAQIILNNQEIYNDSDLNRAAIHLGKKAEIESDIFPSVSVIVPTLNRAEMLKEALKSILNQTYQNFEILVVNDGGEDVSGLIDNFQDSRVKCIAHRKNKGLAAARNTGIRNASGQYIALLDDDDIFYPEHLETAVNTLSIAIPVIYTDAVRATYDRCGDNYHLIKKNVPYSIDFDRNKLLVGNLSPVNCFVFEKNLAVKAGLFDETLSTLEDWDFWIRLSSLTSFKHIAKPTVQVNWRSDGTTMTSLLGAEFGKNRQKIYTKYQAEINQIPNVKEILNEFQKIWAQDWQSESPLTSIIMLTCNQLQYTKKCIESILQNTQKPYELIIVDNGSTDGTVEYLESEVPKNHPDLRIKIIKNKENKGFAGGNNQGMAVASGDYILLLNNDVVVTTGWLERMLSCAEKQPEIGIVGPRSNYVSGPQLVEEVGYDTHTLKGLAEFSNKFADDRASQAQQVLRVVGFCMLIAGGH